MGRGELIGTGDLIGRGSLIGGGAVIGRGLLKGARRGTGRFGLIKGMATFQSQSGWLWPIDQPALYPDLLRQQPFRSFSCLKVLPFP
jgi:hypothetical protein